MSDSEQALSRLDRATQRATERLNQLEARLRAYDSTLSILLQTTQGLVSEVTSTIDRLERTDRLLEDAVRTQLPNVHRNLIEIDDIVLQLERELPIKQISIDGMQTLYYSGRKRLRVIEDELSWLTTPYIVQILKASALFYPIPRSRRWTRNVRLGAYLAIALLAIAIRLYIQAHRFT